MNREEEEQEQEEIRGKGVWNLDPKENLRERERWIFRSRHEVQMREGRKRFFSLSFSFGAWVKKKEVWFK